MGIDIFPGFAATEILRDAGGNVSGAATGDMGIGIGRGFSTSPSA